jgi:hypothetical protein
MAKRPPWEKGEHTGPITLPAHATKSGKEDGQRDHLVGDL